MRRFWHITALLVVVLLIVGGVTGFFLYHASQQVPEFYREAIALDARLQQEKSDELLQQATALASDVRKRGRWQALFTAAQINGWLAVDLVENHKQLLPDSVQDPRVSIEPQRATIACRFDNGELSTVFSIAVDVYLTEPNIVAIRIRNARAGKLPIPLGRVLDEITIAAARLELPIEWRQLDGDPVALVTIPSPHDQNDNVLELDTIELREGEVFLSGHSDPPGEKSSQQAGGTVRRPMLHTQPSVAGSESKEKRQR